MTTTPSLLEERFHRFDDIFKLSLTVLTISLSFGASFFKEFGIIFFAGIVLTFLATVFFWGVGHLLGGDFFGSVFKLLSWWLFSQVTPMILINYLIPRATGEAYPPHIALPILFAGFFVYIGTFFYLRKAFGKWERRGLICMPIGVLIFMSIFTWL